MRTQRFSEEEFQSIYSRVPRLCVDLVIKSENGILLTLRQAHGWEGQWHLPGGTLYLGETLMDAVRRIAAEELGIEVEVTKTLGYIEYPSETKERGYGYSVSVVFLCEPKDLNIRLDDLVAQYSFFKELPENTISEQKHFLRDIL